MRGVAVPALVTVLLALTLGACGQDAATPQPTPTDGDAGPADLPVVDNHAPDPDPDPDADAGTTDTDAEAPDADAEQPDADAQEPDADAEAPDADAQAPDADAEQPDGDAQEPDADTTGCPIDPGPDDFVRKVVGAHPFGSDGGQANTFEVYELDLDGVLTATGELFEMGRAFEGEIVFRADGRVGFVVQDDGTLGVFRFDDTGAVEVVYAAYEGPFYAGSVHLDPGGQHAWVLDSNWVQNGGGLYRVEVACDGTLTPGPLLLESKLPRGLELHPTSDALAVLVADGVGPSDEPGPYDVHLVDLDAAPPALLASATAFPLGDAIISATTRTHDGQYVLIAENSGYSGLPNRVAAVELLAAGIAPVQVLSPFSDPADVVASPFDNAALVVAAMGSDAIFHLSYDPDDPVTPFAVTDELAYAGAGPALPSTAVMVTRGQLTGRVLVSENVAIRQVQFNLDGSATDLGPTSTGAGLTAINGALGVQP